MNININLTDDEMAALKKFMPMLEKVKKIVPPSILSVIHKVEKAMREG